MKIKFDIKYRPQIESGKYKVITASGEPVKIERFDLQGNYPILVVLPTTVSDYEWENSWVEDRPFIYTKTGECHNLVPTDKNYRLFIETGDDLTESERILYNLVNDHVYNHDSIDEEEVHEWMKENFIPVLINDCKTYGDYFYADGNHYLNISRFNEKDIQIPNDNEDKDCIPYEKQWCAFCEFFDGYDMCLRKGNFGAITDETIDKCSNDKLFKTNEKVD